MQTTFIRFGSFRSGVHIVDEERDPTPDFALCGQRLTRQYMIVGSDVCASCLRLAAK